MTNYGGEKRARENEENYRKNPSMEETVFDIKRVKQFDENSEEYAPDLYSIMSSVKNLADENVSVNDIGDYILKQDWVGISQLYESTDPNLSSAIENFVIDIQSRYNEEITGPRARGAKRIGINKKYTEEQWIGLINMLSSRNISYSVIKEKDITSIEYLKSQLNNYLNEKGDPALYYLNITEDTNQVNIDLKYTLLGYLIMLKTEIKHDLKDLFSLGA